MQLRAIAFAPFLIAVTALGMHNGDNNQNHRLATSFARQAYDNLTRVLMNPCVKNSPEKKRQKAAKEALRQAGQLLNALDQEAPLIEKKAYQNTTSKARQALSTLALAIEYAQKAEYEFDDNTQNLKAKFDKAFPDTTYETKLQKAAKISQPITNYFKPTLPIANPPANQTQHTTGTQHNHLLLQSIHNQTESNTNNQNTNRRIVNSAGSFSTHPLEKSQSTRENQIRSVVQDQLNSNSDNKVIKPDGYETETSR